MTAWKFSPISISAICGQVALVSVLALGVQSAIAQVDEAKGKAVATDLNLMVAEATAVIGSLQADINGGTAGDKTGVDPLVNAYLARYQKATGRAFDEKVDGLDSESRKAFLGALRETLVKFQPVMAKGGQDAFVPAFFRAELLKRYNVPMKGRVQAYATNRDKELINADWAVSKVMKGSPLSTEVSQLMQKGDLSSVTKRTADRVMLYTPMKLASACVACHARNGLIQKEGEFGGALIAEVWVK
jgi:hypothetical protein